MTKRNVRMHCVRDTIICTVTSSEKGEVPGGLLSKIGPINRPSAWNFL